MSVILDLSQFFVCLSCSLLLRVCHTLRSRAREVRDAARDTLAKITISLGTQYFPFVLKELRSSLTRGYQVRHDLIHRFGVKLLTCLRRCEHTYCNGRTAELRDNVGREPTNSALVTGIDNRSQWAPLRHFCRCFCYCLFVLLLVFFYRKKKNRNLEKIYNYTIFF